MIVTRVIITSALTQTQDSQTPAGMRVYEGDDGSGMALEVAGEAPVAADPGEGSLHDPGPDGGAA